MPAVEESRVRVSCGVPASLSLSVLPCNTSSPSCIPRHSNHSACPQHQHPCGPVSNALSVLPHFAPRCFYILTRALLWFSHFLSFLHLARPLSLFSFFPFSRPPGVSLSIWFTPTPDLRLSFPSFRCSHLPCNYVWYAGWSVMAVSIVTACMGPKQSVCVWLCEGFSIAELTRKKTLWSVKILAINMLSLFCLRL